MAGCPVRKPHWLPLLCRRKSHTGRADVQIPVSSGSSAPHSKEENQALMEYASNKNINLYNIKKFDGDSELLKEQIDVLSSTLKEFKITDKATVTFADLGDYDFAQTVNNTITFNNKVLRN